MNKVWKRNIILFLSSQTISLFGSALVQYAITWYITLKSQSGAMMTISIICGFLPTLFISPFAGVWADRYNRKILIILADSMIAIATLILAIIFFMGYEAIWLLFLASVIRSIGAGIQSPAVNAFIPQLVPEDNLTKVNATNGTVQSLVMLVAPMASGALLTIASIREIFLIDVVTAALAITILLMFLHVPTHSKALSKEKISYFGDMVKGIKYIKNHSFVATLFAFCAIYFVLVAPLAFLTPLQVTRSFGDDVWRLTAIEITFSIGMMAGGIVMTTWGGFKNKIHTMGFGFLVVATCTALLGVIPNFWIYLFIMMLSGVVMPMFNTPFTVMLQQKVEQDYMGRVFGVLNMISSSAMPLAMIAFGPTADIIKIEWLLIGTGILMFILSLIMLSNKVLLEAGKPIQEE